MATYIGITYQNGHYKIARDTVGYPVTEPDASGAITRAKSNISRPLAGDERYNAERVPGEHAATNAALRAYADEKQRSLNN